MTGPFAAGDPCLLIDGKRRRYLLFLEEGGVFHYHGGTVPHDLLIGSGEGTRVTASSGSRLTALRPGLADYILAMPRGAQVVYPKDIGPILVWADIAPGCVVLEAGTGSGALTIALVRAVGPSGRVISVERREDHAAFARKSITRFFGGLPPNLELRVGEVEEALAGLEPDRVVLDIPEPEAVAVAAAGRLVAGGVFCAYLPTVPQVHTLREALRATGRFTERTTFEVLHREWAAEGRSVRPEHQMVGHTGFVTVARAVPPAPAPAPEPTDGA